MKKTVIELFAGVGGFRLGLERASKEFETIWANQYEPSKKSQDAYDCYVANFGSSESHSNIDINEVNLTEIPEHTLLVGGFPCQDYSVASSGAKGIEGKKGVLWWNVYNILKIKKPKFVLLENVDRLLKSPSKQRGRDFGIILTCFKKEGYSVEWRVINAGDYGFPQRRKRVFIYAYKNDTKYAKNLFKNFNVKDIVTKEGLFQKIFKSNIYDNKRVNNIVLTSNDIKDISDSFENRFWNSGCLLKDNIYTEDLKPIQEKQAILRDILDKDVDEKFYLGDDLSRWEYLKGAKKIKRVSKTGYEYVFSEGALSFPDSIDKSSRTMLTSEASINRSTHVIKDPKTDRLRKITPSECEALNGFPKNWTNTGMSDRGRYFCMGNALVVGVIERIGKELKLIIDNE